MDLGVIWNIFFVIIGLIAGLVKSVPMDMDSIKDGIQMGAIAGVGMAMDLAEKAKVQGSFDDKISMGPIKFEKKFNAGGGIMGNDDDDDDDEDDRKRRRRSVGVFRAKRSPCLGRRRGQQTTTVATPGAGGAGAGGAGAGGAGAGAGGEIDDIPRRRKRSPDYANDYNDNIIPDQKTLAERTQEIGEQFRQMIKGMLDALVGAFDKLKMNIQNGYNN